MPKISAMIVSKFLKQSDIEDDTAATIRGVSLEDMPGDAKEQRWAMTFRELPKPMILNVTAIRVLGAAFGDDTDGWIGQKVTVYVDPNVSFQGKVVGGLRLKPIKAKPAKANAAAPVEEFNGPIPF